MSMPRNSSTVRICERRAAERVGGVDLLRRPGRGSSASVSRGIESLRNVPPPARISMIVSERYGQAVGWRRLAVGRGLEALRLRLGSPASSMPPGARRCRARGSSGRGEQERVAAELVCRLVGELRLLDLGGDREGEEAEQDPAAGGDQRPTSGPLRQSASRPALAARRRRDRAARAARVASPVRSHAAARLVDRVVGRPRRARRRSRRTRAVRPVGAASARPRRPRPGPSIRPGRRCIRGDPGVQGRRVP